MDARRQHGQAATGVNYAAAAAAATVRQGVLVRVGETSWVIAEREPAEEPMLTTATAADQAVVPLQTGSSTTGPGRARGTRWDRKRDIGPDVDHQERRALRSSAHVRPSIRESFRMGLVFGLALGCLGLIVFHQMPSAKAVTATKSSAWPATSALTGPAVTLPATQVYGLSVGVFPDLTSAQVAQARVHNAGVNTVIYPVSGGRQRLLAGIADQPADLQSTLKQIENKHLFAQTVHLITSAKSTPTLPSISKAEGDRISKWLSAEMGAQNALTGALADGEPARDAAAALAQAKRLQPSVQTLSNTGYGSLLNGIVSTTAAAARFGLQSHRPQQAQQKLMTAYSLFATMKQQSP